MKIWLDDVRPAPDGWEWCMSVNDAIIVIRDAERRIRSVRAMMQTLRETWFTQEIRRRWLRQIEKDTIEIISLDHDMGNQVCDGGDGIKLMDWLLERNTLYPLEFHTANPVGRANMERMYRRYWLKESL